MCVAHVVFKHGHVILCPAISREEDAFTAAGRTLTSETEFTDSSANNNITIPTKRERKKEEKRDRARSQRKKDGTTDAYIYIYIGIPRA